MNTAQKIIKYGAIAFAFFLIFSILSGIMTGVMLFSNIWQQEEPNELLQTQIENIPQKNYYFIYYTLLKFNNVYYYMNQEMPSGGIEIDDSDVNISGNYNNEKNITTLNITFQNNVFLKNECIIDNNSYQYDNYEEITSSTTLTILGNMLNKEIKLYFNKYYNNYDEYLDIPILGNIYKEYIKIIN